MEAAHGAPPIATARFATPLVAAPLLWPGLAFVAGAAAGRVLDVALAVLVALLGLGVAAGRRAGGALAALAAGLLVAHLHVAAERDLVAGHDPDRPVRVEGRVAGHPAVRDGDLLLLVRLDRLRDRDGVHRVDLLVRVSVPWSDAVHRDGTASPPAIGARVRLTGRLSRPDVYRNPPRAPPGPWRLRAPSARFVATVAPPATGWRWAARLRAAGDERLAAVAGRPGLVLARALVLGDRAALPEAWTIALRRWGLAHLLAVSGLHVATAAGLVFLAAAPLPRRLRFAAVAVSVLAYLLLVGPRPSVLRATVMALVALAALVGERPPPTLNALALAAIALVAADPAAVGELAFQLSAAATLGIVLLAPRYAARWTAVPRWLRRPLAASVAAQLAVAPFLVPVSAAVHPLAPLANLVAVPWSALVLALGFARLALAPWPAARRLLDAALDLAAAPLDGLAALPPSGLAMVPVAVGPATSLAGAAALGVLVALPRRAVAVGCVVVLAAVARVAFGSGAPSELVALDVGQGDAFLLRDAETAVLVDGGGWPRGDFAARVLVPALAGLGVRRLEAVVLSHPDGDHCGGLAQLVAYLPVAEVWSTPAAARQPCGARLVAAPGPRWRPLWRGHEARRGGFRFTVLHPGPGERAADNDASLVVAVEAGGRRLLLTGDVEAAGERAVAAALGDAPVAVLKVAHHGSRTSTSPAFLARARPRLAVVAAGPRNPYGHPTAEVLDRLRRSGVLVLRTDRDGQVRLPLPVARLD